MKILMVRLALILPAIAVMTGCVSITPNFSATPEFWGAKDGKVVAVAIAKPQPAASYKIGNQGLLDVAINSAMASDLDKHLASLDVMRVNKTADKVAGYLQSKGYNVKQIKDPIDVEALGKFTKPENAPSGAYFADKDFRPLMAQFQADKLVVISLTQFGTIRSYYGFVPLGAPSGISAVSGKAIDLTNNRLEWNQAHSQTLPVTTGDWDLPPDYPHLTKAIDTALDRTQTLLYQSFAQ